MFKKKKNLTISVYEYDIDDWKTIEQLIKDNWEIKEIQKYTNPITHITLTK